MAYSSPSIPPFPSDLPTKTLTRISFAGLLDGASDDDEKLYSACSSDGFVLLDLTDSEEGRKYIAVVDEMFKLQDQLFSLDMDEKNKYVGKAFLGYKPMGSTRGDLQGRPDRFEMWSAEKEDILGMSAPNPMPSILTSQKHVLVSFVRGVHKIVDMLLASFERSLRMPPGALTHIHRLDLETHDPCRMNCHPPLKQTSQQRSNFMPHRDFASLTVLFNILGGLQFVPQGKDPKDEENWLYIKPVPGHAIINIGDVLVAFTNGALCSPMHRVVPPPGDQAALTRHSLAYFARPEITTVVQPLKGGGIPPMEEGQQEEGLMARDWFAAKVKSILVK